MHRPADVPRPAPARRVLLYLDGMLTTAESRFYLEALAAIRPVAVITGHAVQGTPAANLLTPVRRNSIAMQTEKITIKVHADDEDVLSVCRRLGTRQVLLFTRRYRMLCLYEAIAHLGDS